MSMEAKTNKKRTVKQRAVNARAEQKKRLTTAAINEALAQKRCSGCTSVGAWEIYKPKGRIRYIRCKACGFCDSVPVIIKE